MQTYPICFQLDGLEVLIFDNRTLMGKQAAEDVAACMSALLREKEEINMIFAAAPSQNEFLQALLQQDLPWGKVNAFHMDEYVGLEPNAPQGFGNFLREKLFDLVPFKSVHYLDGNASDAVASSNAYAVLLRHYPVDIVCMGIGENGHLAFNDPPVADFKDPLLVKKVELDAVCRQQQVNDGCFATLDDVPTEALTLTIPALMQAAWVFSMVPGPTKSDAVKRTILGAISEDCPATILRNHENAKLYLDKESGRYLL